MKIIQKTKSYKIIIKLITTIIITTFLCQNVAWASDSFSNFIKKQDKEDVLAPVSPFQKPILIDEEHTVSNIIEELLKREQQSIIFTTSKNPTQKYRLSIQKDFVAKGIFDTGDGPTKYMFYVEAMSNDETEVLSPAGIATGIYMDEDDILNLEWIITFDYEGLITELKQFRTQLKSGTSLIDAMGIYFVIGMRADYKIQAKFLWSYLRANYGEDIDDSFLEYYMDTYGNLRSNGIGYAMSEFLTSFAPIGSKIKYAVAHEESLELLRNREPFSNTPVGKWWGRLGYEAIDEFKGKEGELFGFIIEKKRSPTAVTSWQDENTLGEYCALPVSDEGAERDGAGQEEDDDNDPGTATARCVGWVPSPTMFLVSIAMGYEIISLTLFIMGILALHFHELGHKIAMGDKFKLNWLNPVAFWDIEWDLSNKMLIFLTFGIIYGRAEVNISSIATRDIEKIFKGGLKANLVIAGFMCVLLMIFNISGLLQTIAYSFIFINFITMILSGNYFSGVFGVKNDMNIMRQQLLIRSLSDPLMYFIYGEEETIDHRSSLDYSVRIFIKRLSNKIEDIDYSVETVRKMIMFLTDMLGDAGITKEDRKSIWDELQRAIVMSDDPARCVIGISHVLSYNKWPSHHKRMFESLRDSIHGDKENIKRFVKFIRNYIYMSTGERAMKHLTKNKHFRIESEVGTDALDLFYGQDLSIIGERIGAGAEHLKGCKGIVFTDWEGGGADSIPSSLMWEDRYITVCSKDAFYSKQAGMFFINYKRVKHLKHRPKHEFIQYLYRMFAAHIYGEKAEIEADRVMNDRMWLASDFLSVVGGALSDVMAETPEGRRRMGRAEDHLNAVREYSTRNEADDEIGTSI